MNATAIITLGTEKIFAILKKIYVPLFHKTIKTLNKMNEKVNIAELLKDCPKGMELDCTLYDNVTFDRVSFDGDYPIKVDTPKGELILNKYGQYFNNNFSKCVIFPKGKTSWEGFVPPYKFKDGDVVTNILGEIIIYKKISTYGYCGSFVSLDMYNQLIPHYQSYLTCILCLSTEEEKEKLFKAIKDNGYKWNVETNTLVELVKPKFKVGDWIMIDKPCRIISINDNGNYIVQYCDIEKTLEQSKKFCESNFHRWTIQDAKDGDVLFHSDSASNGIFIFKEILQCGTIQKVICYCDYDSEDGFCLGENHTCCWADSKILHPATKEQRDILFQKTKEAGYEWKSETNTLVELVKPKFKVGDYVTRKGGITVPVLISRVGSDYYYSDMGNSVGVFTIKEQDDWELVPKKFDINILKPFESRVLVRSESCKLWKPAIFGCRLEGAHSPYYALGGTCWKYCIPYEGNEHLLGTTDDCDEYYENW